MFKVLLQHGSADLELKNADGYTVLWLALQEVSYSPLHCSIFCKNKAVFKVLLQHGSADLELKNADGFTVLWLALQEVSSPPLLKDLYF